MIAPKSLARIAPLAIRLQARQLTAVGAPPVKRMALSGKIVHGLIIASAMMSVPIWVATNFNKYRTKSE